MYTQRVTVTGFDESPRVDTWDSRREMLVSLEAKRVPWIEIEPCQHLSDLHIAVTVGGVTVAFDTEIAGVTPQLARFPGLPLWYLGWDTYIAGLDVAAGGQAFLFVLRTAFWEFGYRSANELIALHELGALLFDPTGTEVWDYCAVDRAIDWEPLSTGLRVVLDNEQQVLLDWVTGGEIAGS